MRNELHWNFEGIGFYISIRSTHSFSPLWLRTILSPGKIKTWFIVLSFQARPCNYRYQTKCFHLTNYKMFNCFQLLTHRHIKESKFVNNNEKILKIKRYKWESILVFVSLFLILFQEDEYRKLCQNWSFENRKIRIEYTVMTP